jgi:hypothetical protein
MYSRIKYSIRTTWSPRGRAMIVTSPGPPDSIAHPNGDRAWIVVGPASPTVTLVVAATARSTSSPSTIATSMNKILAENTNRPFMKFLTRQEPCDLLAPVSGAFLIPGLRIQARMLPAPAR